MVGRQAGVPIGPTRCGRCGAEGVNRRTCTGDADTHVLLAKEHRTTLGSGNQPSYNTEDGKQPAREWEYGKKADERIAARRAELEAGVPLEEPDSLLTGEVVYTLPFGRDRATPMLVKTTLTFITKTPLALENCARLSIDEAELESIWLETTFEDLEL